MRIITKSRPSHTFLFEYGKHLIFKGWPRVALKRSYSDNTYYDPEKHESELYSIWMEGKFPEIKKQPIRILMPPPNITGILHIGHALTFTIQDILVRYHKMNRKSVRWIPGLDHAGIGAQIVFERELLKKGIQSQDLSREKRIEAMNQWTRIYAEKIQKQMMKLGLVVDWDRFFFTLDAGHTHIVQRAFVELFNQGLIYRDNRIVNWCCYLQSVISDIEVSYESIKGVTQLELPGRKEKVQVGSLYHIAYPLENPIRDLKEVVVATTRPETLLADVAIAVHPDDPRYQNVIGQNVFHPLLKRFIPIIADSEMVDMDFGTGAVKITPGHDFADFECGKRHQLETINLFGKNGHVLSEDRFKSFSGLDRFECRKIVVKELQQMDFLRGQDDSYESSIARCSRSGDIIEPMIQPQWFLNCKDMAANAHAFVRQGQLKIYPEEHEKHWYHWLENIQDWCISRQLWWGHSIPAFHAKFKKDIPPRWFAASTREEAETQVSRFLRDKSLPEDSLQSLQQDQDVLDTWFSSSLLPIYTLSQSEYPLTLMETGSDILFFWVARMVMLCHHFTGYLPYSEIRLHPMVRDSEGRKMSKSLGNVIDPLSVIEGSTDSRAYGADSLRYTLIFSSQQTRQINLSMSNVTSAASFCNKIWNAFSLIEAHLTSLDAKPIISYFHNHFDLPNPASLETSFILSKLYHAVDYCHLAYENKQFHLVCEELRRFLYDDFCSIYLEFIKPSLSSKKEEDAPLRKEILYTSVHVLDTFLRLLHPIMPFITESLWQALVLHSHFDHYPEYTLSILGANFPRPEAYIHFKDPKSEANLEIINKILHACRSLRQSNKIGEPLPYWVVVNDSKSKYFNSFKELLTHYRPLLVKAGSLSDILLKKKSEFGKDHFALPSLLVNENISVVVDSSNYRLSQEQQLEKLYKQLDKLDEDLRNIQSKLKNPQYQFKAKDIAKKRDYNKLTLLTEKHEKVTNEIEAIKRLMS